ncbi:hypothetical protein DFJ58DRAFT_724497 [Suillus subalutaceus]|uniref:uncharacterized protein n=1 Tax=Suillus subalutaceus TaxID=48586 RepID=UPI001B8774C6|nr:uncharacterized protein DFJ58DRAFT_724497 [Suillus subalutaceus]KAG1864938.1 hypothetical protein DFJ58DRAFT_724497 [Suillus subalutaceus]
MGYRLGDLFISVLDDFDLSSTKRDGPRGFERTGTIPFMSLHILVLKAIAGKVEQIRNRPLDECLTGDVMGKNQLSGDGDEICPTPSHEGNFKIAMYCLEVIHKYTGPFAFVPADDEEVFLIWLHHHVPVLVREGNLLSVHAADLCPSPAGGMNATTRAAVRYCVRGLLDTTSTNFPGSVSMHGPPVALHVAKSTNRTLPDVDLDTVAARFQEHSNCTLPDIDLGAVGARFQERNFHALLMIGGLEAFNALLILEAKYYPAFHIPMARLPVPISNNGANDRVQLE